MGTCARAVFLALAALPSSPGAEIAVPGDHAEIQAALDAARDGDTVLVGPGEYAVTEPLTFRGKSIALRSTGGPARTAIRSGERPAPRETRPVLSCEPGVS